MDPDLVAAARSARGFMPDDEGLALYDAAASVAGRIAGPLVEIGTWCGKSAIYLGAAAREAGTVLFTVDHHHGSEENQVGWEHHDPDLVDPETGRIDTLPFFRRAMRAAGLEEVVIAVVGDSIEVAKYWNTPAAMVFIDGGHGAEPAHADFEAWAPQVAPGGFLAIHDVFADPAEGGRPPFEIYGRALESGVFEEEHDLSPVGSLRVLRRLGA